MCVLRGKRFAAHLLFKICAICWGLSGLPLRRSSLLSRRFEELSRSFESLRLFVRSNVFEFELVAVCQLASFAELRMLTWLGFTMFLEHSLYSSAIELFFMITEPPRRSKRLFVGDAAPPLVGDPPISRDLFAFVIIRLSRGEKGLLGEGGSIEFFRLIDA